MDKLPILPDHYIALTVDDMKENEICFLKGEFLFADTVTHQPYINKYVPIDASDRTPKRLLGRFGIMRVFANKLAADTPVVDGYIIDVRELEHYGIPAEKFTSNEDDSSEVIRQLTEATKDFISPLGIIAKDSENKEQLYFHEPSLKKSMWDLLNYADQLQAELQSKAGVQKKVSTKKHVPTQEDERASDTTNTLDSRPSE